VFDLHLDTDRPLPNLALEGVGGCDRGTGHARVGGAADSPHHGLGALAYFGQKSLT
jgi:hypothetical protein